MFLSSTFRDMQFEREYLIKNIFPEIRQACRERLVEFTEIDLRWGVTEDEAREGKVVRICLEEIDQCRPYFLGFMGERYGWQPNDSDIFHKDELVKLFPLVEPSLKDNKSVTEMEMLHGVLESPQMVEHAFFYIRDQSLTAELAKKSGSPADYYDTSVSAQEKLKILKSNVKSSGFPYFENYPSIEALGESVKLDVFRVLDQCYPINNVLTPIETERMVHEAYAVDRCQGYLPNEPDINALDVYIKSHKHDNLMPPLIIGGESGLGKSALLAYYLGEYQKNNSESFVIQHFVGVSGDATPSSVLRRIMLEIKVRNEEQDDVPSNHEDIVNYFPHWLGKVRHNDPLLLVIDAINQIEGENLGWLPSHIPPNVILIVSALPGTHYEQLKKRGWKTHTIEHLDTERRAQLIKYYLNTYRKELSEKQIKRISCAPQCGNPLFLITLLEELRVFGIHEKIDERIVDCLKADEPASLFVEVLQRMEKDYQNKQQVSTVPIILKSIWASRKGLTETELLGITGFIRQDLSIVLLVLDYHLSNKNGLRNFFHDYLRQSVTKRYLYKDEVIKDQHLILANWFDKQKLDFRKAEELPWQLQRAREMKKLKSCICDLDMFHFLYEKNPLELVTYWRDLGDTAKKAGLAYWNIFGTQAAKNVSSAKIAIELGEFFLKYYVDSAISELFLRYALDYIEKNVDELNDLNAIPVLNLLASSLIDQGIPSGTEKICRRVLKLCSEFQNHGEITAAHNLAEYLLRNGKEQEADEIYHDVVARRLSVPLDSESLEGAQLFYNYGEYLYERRENAKAYEYTLKALKIRLRFFGKDNPETAKAYHNVGVMAKDVKYLRHALDIFQKLFGDNHPDTVVAKCNLADMMIESSGDPFCADDLFESASFGWNKCRGGASHQDTPNSLINYLNRVDFYSDGLDDFADDSDVDFIPDEELDRLIEKENKPENDAIEHLEYCEVKFGKNSVETGNALEKLIDVQKTVFLGSSKIIIESQWLRLLSIRENYSDESKYYRPLCELASINRTKTPDGLKKSLSFYRRALEINIPMSDKLDALYACGNVLWDLNQHEEAKKMLLQEFAASQKYTSVDMQHIWNSGDNLINKLLKSQYFDDAEVICRKIIGLCVNDEMKLAVAMHNLGIALLGQGKNEEVEAIFRKEISEINNLHGADSHYGNALVLVQQNLARLLYEKGNYAEASQLLHASILGGESCA